MIISYNIPQIRAENNRSPNQKGGTKSPGSGSLSLIAYRYSYKKKGPTPLTRVLAIPQNVAGFRII